jgi:hypothetical protein
LYFCLFSSLLMCRVYLRWRVVGFSCFFRCCSRMGAKISIGIQRAMLYYWACIVFLCGAGSLRVAFCPPCLLGSRSQMSIFSYVYGLRVTSGVLGGRELLPVTVLVKDPSLVPCAFLYCTAAVIWMYMNLRVFGYRPRGAVRIASNPCFHYSGDACLCYVRPACAFINY